MRAVFSRNGYVKEAHYRDGWPVGDGFADSVAYAMLRRDWEAGAMTPVRWES
ncbi:hypothetical protein ACFVWR_06025 [Leifsonia sp. NPDC058292]|uniref:hypothetical protein n=1 Tax=Leifsonia sp. NPDC058292 TaxID=3346428 RepID=UPI0036DD8DE6